MSSDKNRRERVAALSVAAAELIEDHHDELVLKMPRDPEFQRARMRRLRRLGADLLVLGQAGLVLLRNNGSD